jgi:hypothetical protein
MERESITRQISELALRIRNGRDNHDEEAEIERLEKELDKIDFPEVTNGRDE